MNWCLSIRQESKSDKLNSTVDCSSYIMYIAYFSLQFCLEHIFTYKMAISV